MADGENPVIQRLWFSPCLIPGEDFADVATVDYQPAERELRAVAVGRKNWTFARSDEGGRRAGAIYTLIRTAKLNDVDPQAWLADILARLPDHPAKRIAELLPWNWNNQRQEKSAA